MGIRVDSWVFVSEKYETNMNEQSRKQTSSRLISLLLAIKLKFY